MRVLILAAGFGTRLEKDIKESGRYKELQGVPKPLLPVCGKPVISHWLDMLAACPETSGEVYVIVNDANRVFFEEWARDYPVVQLVSSGSSTNETRPGAVACIEIAVRHFNIQDHLLVIGGSLEGMYCSTLQSSMCPSPNPIPSDTLFYEDFSLADFLSEFHKSPAVQSGGGFIPYYTCPDEDTCKRGILELDEGGKVVHFLEKPKSTETTSRKANPCLYLYSRNALPLLTAFLDEKKNSPLKERDATGNFVKYLYPRRPIYTHEISGRYDIGGLESYLHCCSNYHPPSNQTLSH